MAAMVRAAGAGCAAAGAESPVELAQRLGAERAAAVQGLTAEQAARRAAEDRAAAAESRTSEVAEVRAAMCQGAAGDCALHGKQCGTVTTSRICPARNLARRTWWCVWRVEGHFNIGSPSQIMLFLFAGMGSCLAGSRHCRMTRSCSRRTRVLGITATLPNIVRPSYAG